jgi:membrane-associated phospholipid phosphatase
MRGLRSLVPSTALYLAIALLGGSLVARDVRAQTADTATVRPSPAFGWPEVKGFALTAALGGVASLADQSMRDAARSAGPQNSDLVHGVAEYGDLFGQPVSLALAWVMYGGGLYAKRPVMAKAGFRAVETISVSGGVTWLLKQVFGRARPEISPNDPGDWEFGRGFGKLDGDYLSMPSGHTTAAFAFATAVTRSVAREAPQHARWVGLVTYGSATATAYARIYKDRHWLSDVVVGAGIGTVTGLAIDRWHATRPNDRIDGFFLKPVLAPLRDGSTGLGFSMQFR